MQSKNLSRRDFMKNGSALSMALGTGLVLPHASRADSRGVQDDNLINIVGPRKGYSPHIGTLVSMMNWMRSTILYSVRGLSIKDLDYLHDENSNSIGAMLLHLAATERFYQIHTFEGREWGDWSEEDDLAWSTAMGLGDAGRKNIKGNPIEYYMKKLQEVREHTLKEFANRDDEWLMQVDKEWGWGPTNNYCKWFHVCEHESNHNGQIKYIAKRLPI